MKIKRIFLFCLVTVFFSLFSCTHDVSGKPYFKARIVSLVSKDLFKIQFIDYVPDGLQSIEQVRLIGINTPLLKNQDNPYATDEPFAAEALSKMKSLCGKSVKILFDDKLQYSRSSDGSLYIYAYEGETYEASISESLIRQGYAAYWNLGLQLEERKNKDFIYAQEQAQFDKLGMWK